MDDPRFPPGWLATELRRALEEIMTKPYLSKEWRRSFEDALRARSRP